jgi:thiol-disulfide isomerase/thioredoxin
MSSDRERVETASSEGGNAAPAVSRGGLGTIVFFLILAAGVGLLSFVILVRPAWLGRGDNLSSLPKLESLELTPVLAEDKPVFLSDVDGKVVLINFWGTWCPPCVHEFPDILALEQEYRERTDFKVLAVSCGKDADEAKDMPKVRVATQAFLEHRFVKMPVYLDPDQKTRTAVLEVAAQRVLNLQYLPVTLLLDREQRIHRVWVGATSKAEFAEEIERLLNEK